MLFTSNAGIVHQTNGNITVIIEQDDVVIALPTLSKAPPDQWNGGIYWSDEDPSIGVHNVATYVYYNTPRLRNFLGFDCWNKDTPDNN